MRGRAAGVCIVLGLGSCGGDRQEPDTQARSGSAKPAPAPPILPLDAAGSQKPPFDAAEPSASSTTKKTLPIEMSWSDAASYARSIGYPSVGVGADPNVLLADGEKCTTPNDCRTKRPRLIFEYAKANDDKPPRCISVMQGGPLDWRAAVTRYTGADTAGLREPRPRANGTVDDTLELKSSIGMLKLLIDGDGAVFNVSFGPACER